MMSTRQPVDGRTVALAGAIYGSWMLVLTAHGSLPWWATVSALAVTIAWHGSLQHEVLHGHPFTSQRANDTLGSPPLALRLPYPVYRRYHLEHHGSSLTDPVDDAESFYISAERWAAMPAIGRGLAVAHHTLLGRLVLGPFVATIRLWTSQVTAIRRGDRGLASCWAIHVASVAGLLWIIVAVVGLPAWQYLAAAYLGHSLTLLRSYCEHRWVAGEGSCTAMVRSGRVLSLLFLNNNLHHAHHARPSVAWHRLPALADELASDEAAAAGAGLYIGYTDVARRYLLHPFDHPLHPLERPGHMANA